MTIIRIKKSGVDNILRIGYYIAGIILTSIALTFLVLYSNLFAFGYSFLDYLLFVIKKLECLSIIPGIILVCCSFRKGNER